MTDQQLKAWELNLQASRDVVTRAKYMGELAESRRHNLAYETETYRHNVATEQAAREQLGVSRHQAESARITALATDKNAYTNWYNAQINAWNAATNERNAATNERNALTNEKNAETNRLMLGPQWLSAQGAYMRGQAGMLSAHTAQQHMLNEYTLGLLNYETNAYRAVTDRYGTVMNAGSNRMQAEAQKQNAQTRLLEHQLAIRNSQYQRDLWASQAESNRVRTDIDKAWGYAEAKASAYDKMANAMYKSKATDLMPYQWASQTSLGIVNAATSGAAAALRAGAGTPLFKYNGSFRNEESGIYYLQP